jgi:hypothetical protein
MVLVVLTVVRNRPVDTGLLRDRSGLPLRLDGSLLHLIVRRFPSLVGLLLLSSVDTDRAVVV